jgi:uncharacterized protein
VHTVDTPPDRGLTDRITRFGRVLRGAGLTLGPGHVIRGIQALSVVDITRRDEFFGALHATWVHRVEDRELFAEAFRLFWRDPDRRANRVLEELLASSRLTPPRPPAHTRRRVWDALERDRAPQRDEVPAPEGETVRLTYSAQEVLRTKDFEQMSAPELAEAAEALKRMRFGVRDLTTRRWQPARAGGSVDMRRTMRAAMKEGRDHIPLRLRKRRQRPPGLVVLCDISGSMAGYTRMLLRFLHALTNDRDRVQTFLFGTRLSNITRSLRHRDPDVAFFELGHRVRDWEGGTRIGACLAEFNRDWSRRVLAQGAWVLLITDGLDRDESVDLGHEVARISRSSRRLVWLNPLLRFADFRPEARGVRAMLPHVDEFRPVHNLASLESLAATLSRQANGGRFSPGPAPV